MREIRSAADAVATLLKDRAPREDVRQAFTDAGRSSWRRFDQAYAVAMRYHVELPRTPPDEFAHLLNQLRELFAHDDRQHGFLRQPELDLLMENLRTYATVVETSLRSILPKSRLRLTR